MIPSGLNAKDNFHRPFLKHQSTFGRPPERINKQGFHREYGLEFRGKDLPSLAQYQEPQAEEPHKFASKSLPRDERICPMVSKHQLGLANVSPQRY